MSLFTSFRVHPAGIVPVGIFFLASVILYHISHALGFVGGVLSCWCVYFFRDPERVFLEKPSSIVSPSDGLIMDVSSGPLPQGIEDGNLLEHRGKQWKKVSIFLNVFDVHVTRAPFGGKVLRRLYNPGQFLNASLDKASDLNERMAVLIEAESYAEQDQEEQTEVKIEGINGDSKKKNYAWCVQIAGLIARRIVCDAQENRTLSKGGRYGIIRFGSRVDLYLPENVDLWVCKGQRVVGGETIVGFFKS